MKADLQPDTESLAADIQKIVGRQHVLITLEDREEYAFDASSPDRAKQLLGHDAPLPHLAVRPGSTHEVQEVVRLANAKRVPIVPFGGGTGVMGGAVPTRHCIMVDMKRMNAVVEISPGALMVRVQAGIILEELNDALEARGLMFGHDPWSRGIATVGGAISTNGVGYLAAKCGTMGDQVLDLQVVLPTGSLVEGKTTSTAAGPRLFALCVGGEGVFGIVTEAVLRVFPKPEARLLLAVEFPHFAAGYGAIVQMAQRGVRPSMIDYTETPNEGGRPLLALAFEGLRAEAGVHVDAGLAICAEYGGRDAGAKTALDFWETRHATAEGWKDRNSKGRRFARGQWGGRRSGWFDYLHLSLMPEKVLGYRERAAQMIAAAGCEVREFGIWGRADLFSVGVVGTAEVQEKGAALGELLVAMAQDMGGSMEYCHGVGLKLRSLMPRERGEGLEALKHIKRALDPNNILNPGKLGLD